MPFADIVAETHARVAADKVRYPPEQVEQGTLFDTIPDRLADAFLPGEINVITEIKFASPSRGRIFDPEVLAPQDIARAYVDNGAKALSILTEPRYFQGSYDYVVAVRRQHPRVPIVMKDFMLDPYQIHLAHFLGASTVLLVVRYLDEPQLKDYFQLAEELGLDALVEVHDPDELEVASRTGCRVMGVNNRNLKTLEIDLDIGRELAPEFPEGVIRICESGISERAQIREFERLGYHGFLIGTSLMKDGRPGPALRELLRA